MNEISKWYHDVMVWVEQLIGYHPSDPKALAAKKVISEKVAGAPAGVTAEQKSQVVSTAAAAASAIPAVAVTGPPGGATGAPGVAGAKGVSDPVGPTGVVGASGATG